MSSGSTVMEDFTISLHHWPW